MPGASFHDEGSVVRVAGEVDMGSAPELAEFLATRQLEGGDLVIDCTELRFLDSSGINALIAVNRRLERSGSRIRLVDVPDHIVRVLELTGLAQWLEP